MSDLITVIIPVYNVEKYVSKCIDSVLNQTYSNLEIFLVDDGSTDSSGNICDDYGDRYDNIHVIHKANGGLSSARNAAMKLMRGRYVMFLDSDDWIEEETIGFLHGLIVDQHADMSAVRFNPIYSDTAKNTDIHSDRCTAFDREEALATFLFDGYLSPCACGKLWKAESWKGIAFPEGKLFEDQFTIYKVLDRIDKSILSENKYYNYLKRENSIGHSAFSKRTYDLYEAVNTECDYIEKNHPAIAKDVRIARISWEIIFINMMLRSTSRDRRLMASVRKETRKHLWDALHCKYLRRVRKVQMVLFAHCYPLYYVVYMLYKIRHRYS